MFTLSCQSTSPAVPSFGSDAETPNGRVCRQQFDESQCVQDLVTIAARRTPQAVAVSFGGCALTYAELDTRANRLAHYLRSLGAGPDVLIGFCCHRSPEAIVAMLGILKAGAAFVPLDPTYPEHRLHFMVEDSQAPIIVTHRQAVEALPTTGARLVILENEAAEIDAQPALEPIRLSTPQSLAYAIYTSGSTGTPKGVLLEHRGLVNLLHTYGALFHLQGSTRFLQFARFSFDAAIWEIFLTLTQGGTLVMAEQSTLLGTRELAQLIRDERVEAATLPPSVLAMLDPAEVPMLRTVVSAGEACPAEIVDRWAPGRRFINAYGPTEVTICSSAAVCRAGEGKPSIGPPLPNTEQWVMDSNGMPQPLGVPGELWLGGIGLARGYHRRPDLTAERFVRHPFAPDPDARLYRTGDLVRWRPDGALDYLGRIDSQVKLRGFRVELPEIEAVLRQHPAVADVAVALHEEAGSPPRLVAYIVPRRPRVV